MFVVLTEMEYNKCVEFARKCAVNQQRIEFGQSDTKPRCVSEISRDNLIGKMAEVAFSKMLHDVYQIDIALDFNYYPRGEWDDQDAVINGWRIDVKATRRGGRWMLIEWSKLDFRQKQDKLSHLYVMAIVDWNRNCDMPSRRVEMVGCASVMKLRPGVPTTLVLRKGSCIPGTNTRLQADNYGIVFSELEKDWESVIHYITTHSPPDLSNYPNPYTGKLVYKEPLHPSPQNQLNSQPVEMQESKADNRNMFTKLKVWVSSICRRMFE